MGLLISKNGIVQDYNRSKNQRHQTSIQERKGQEKREQGSNEEQKHKQKNNPYKAALSSYKDQKVESTKAKSIASLAPITGSQEDTVEKALSTMKKYKIHHLIFIDERKKLIGIISDRDILDKRRSDIAYTFASKEVIAAKENTDIKMICSLMIEKLVSAVPLLNDEGHVTGIITKTDLLEYVFKSQSLQVYV